MGLWQGDLGIFWGKYRGRTPEDEPEYHPAVLHMLDVGAVAEAFMSTWTERFAELLGCPPEHAGPWVPMLIAGHDLGKVHPGFQQKIDDPELIAGLLATGLPLIPKAKQESLTVGFDHGLQTVLSLADWLVPRLVVSGSEPAFLVLPTPWPEPSGPTTAATIRRGRSGTTWVSMAGTTAAGGPRPGDGSSTGWPGSSLVTGPSSGSRRQISRHSFWPSPA